ncbi:MAG: hypothetical protein GW886_15205 [Rhodobacterales bacterium]|nr:hypothetical protein [Rhodobacterales bacterium]NCT12108.1 hypothetical protein [Rhodobacterales bacterium]
MSLLSRLFGGKSGGDAPASSGPAEEYKGYAITPAPIQSGGQYRVAARIEKTIDGTLRTHSLTRADTMASQEDAMAISLAKAKQVIDEQGDRIFQI